MKRTASLLAILVAAFAAACAVGTAPPGGALATPPEAEDSSDPSNEEGNESIVPEAGSGTEPDSAPTANSKKQDATADTGSAHDDGGSQAANDAGVSPPACPGFADPNESAPCHACTTATKPNCQPNHCYGGYFCDLAQSKCVPPPSGC